MDCFKPDRLPAPTAAQPLPDRVKDALTAAISAMRYGSIQLVVHEGKVVQLDVTERQRF